MNSVPKSPPVVEPPLSRNPQSRPVATTESPIERLRDAIGDVVFFGGRGDRDELWTASERMGIATHAAFTNRPDIVSATVAKQLEAARRGFVDACCTCAIYSRDCENREQSQQRVLDSAKDAKSAYGKALVDLQEWLRVEQLYPSALTKTALDEHAAEPTTGDLSPLGTETPSADATPKGATEQQSPAKLAKLKRCEQKAYLAYKFATEKLEVRPNELIDNEVYKWLSEESLPDNLFDGADKYELPSFDTWTKYLRKVRRELGESKYNRRSPTTTTRSVVQYRDLDSPCDD